MRSGAVQRPPSAPSRLAAGSIFAFVVLGLPDGMLGVAWPALRHGFSQPLASLGELLLASMLGYLGIASLTGWLLRRFGTVKVLIVAAVSAAGGAAAFGAARWWAVLVVASVLLGCAGGGLDAALNTAVAVDRRPRLINLIHAAYGAGAALGPLVVTGALAIGSSWRGAYGLLFVVELALLAVWISLRDAFPPIPRSDAAAEPDGGIGEGRSRHLSLLLALSLAVFFIYTGLEVAVASWSATFLRGPGGASATLAGVAVFLYWAGLTVGRLGAAALGQRLSPRNAARAGILVTLAGAAVLVANLPTAAAVIALVVIGLGLGPVFPALVNLTPERFGTAGAVGAMGWEIAAAGLGGAGLSALVGVMLQLAGLSSFGAALVLLATALGALNVLIERATAAP